MPPATPCLLDASQYAARPAKDNPRVARIVRGSGLQAWLDAQTRAGLFVLYSGDGIALAEPSATRAEAEGTNWCILASPVLVTGAPADGAMGMALDAGLGFADPFGIFRGAAKGALGALSSTAQGYSAQLGPVPGGGGGGGRSTRPSPSIRVQAEPAPPPPSDAELEAEFRGFDDAELSRLMFSRFMAYGTRELARRELARRGGAKPVDTTTKAA